MMKTILMYCIYAFVPALTLYSTPDMIAHYPDALSWCWIILVCIWYIWLLYQIYKTVRLHKELPTHFLFPIMMYLFGFLLLREFTGIPKRDKVLSFYTVCLCFYNLYIRWVDKKQKNITI